jgi:DNA-binding NtrC family response regulator
MIIPSGGAESEQTMPKPATEAAERPLTIVIVDDEPVNRKALSRFFRERGYAPRLFGSAEAALSEIREGLAPDLVISDYRMPGMDGLQFVEQLRASKIAAPVIVLTAYGDIDAYFRFFSLGVFEYVHKPVGHSELERIVRAALKGTRLRGLPAAGSH